jgi:ribonuclease HI
MEILAVAEALANIPDGMHVWIMTDSAYVKNGIGQWVSTWQRNGWKNSSGTRVANQLLWRKLIEGVKRMRRVEWSRVKAHNGRLLNECADMLATRGVFNEPRPCPVTTIRVTSEDSDHAEYELLDGEETPVAGKDGDEHPLGRTYVLKAGPEVTDPFNVRSSSSTGSVVEIERAIEEGLKETLKSNKRSKSVSAQSPVEYEDEGPFPIPEETDPSEDSPGRIDWNDTEATARRRYR